MKSIAYLLIAAGFLGGATVTALDVATVNWLWFGVAAVAAIAGVILAKRADKSRATDSALLESNRAELNDSLSNLLATLQQRQDDTYVGQARLDWIDAALRPDLRRFAEARESLVHLYGLQAYADIMSEFAAGERYVNRAWSSMADGYADESDAYLERASAQFEDAQRLQMAASRTAAA